MGNYASTHSVLPPGVVNDKGPVLDLPTGYHHGWTVQILPFIGQNNVYRRFNMNESVYAASNFTVRSVVIGTFLCPSNPFRAPPRATQAATTTSRRRSRPTITASSFLNSHVVLDDISDGSAQTILIGEMRQADPSELGWASGTSATLRNTGHPINDPIGTQALFKNMPNLTGPERIAAVQQMADEGILPIEFVGGFSSHSSHGIQFSLLRRVGSIPEKLDRAARLSASGPPC